MIYLSHCICMWYVIALPNKQSLRYLGPVIAWRAHCGYRSKTEKTAPTKSGELLYYLRLHPFPVVIGRRTNIRCQTADLATVNVSSVWNLHQSGYGTMGSYDLTMVPMIWLLFANYIWHAYPLNLPAWGLFVLPNPAPTIKIHSDQAILDYINLSPRRSLCRIGFGSPCWLSPAAKKDMTFSHSRARCIYLCPLAWQGSYIPGFAVVVLAKLLELADFGQISQV